MLVTVEVDSSRARGGLIIIDILLSVPSRSVSDTRQRLLHSLIAVGTSPERIASLRRSLRWIDALRGR